MQTKQTIMIENLEGREFYSVSTAPAVHAAVKSTPAIHETKVLPLAVYNGTVTADGKTASRTLVVSILTDADGNATARMGGFSGDLSLTGTHIDSTYTFTGTKGRTTFSLTLTLDNTGKLMTGTVSTQEGTADPKTGIASLKKVELPVKKETKPSKSDNVTPVTPVAKMIVNCFKGVAKSTTSDMKRNIQVNVISVDNGPTYITFKLDGTDSQWAAVPATKDGNTVSGTFTRDGRTVTVSVTISDDGKTITGSASLVKDTTTMAITFDGTKFTPPAGQK